MLSENEIILPVNPWFTQVRFYVNERAPCPFRTEWYLRLFSNAYGGTIVQVRNLAKFIQCRFPYL